MHSHGAVIASVLTFSYLCLAFDTDDSCGESSCDVPYLGVGEEELGSTLFIQVDVGSMQLEDIPTAEAVKRAAAEAPASVKAAAKAKVTGTGGESYGNGKCKCIGIEGLSGAAEVIINGEKVKGLYTADLGTYCSAWDEGKHPGACDGDIVEEWCAAQWCYVDPCECDIDIKPKLTYFLPDATSGGKPLFYSYSTCGSDITFGEPATEAIEAACSQEWNLDLGIKSCPCVGIADREGTTRVVIGNTSIFDLYPADIGSSCRAWDENVFPGTCDVTNNETPEEWCSQSWCYVDVKNCKLPEGEKGPFESDLLPDGKFRGTHVHYSYVACGGTNSYLDDSTPDDELATAISTHSYGVDTCKCIAIEGLSGSVDVEIANKTIKDVYSAELGSYCNAWDQGKYPGSCDSDKPEEWCARQWCYVDPCDCEIPTHPAKSIRLPNATYHGKPLFFSYATCGDESPFGAGDPGAIESTCIGVWNKAHDGLAECPCVGVAGRPGFTDVFIGETVSDLYPSELGSFCNVWDDDTYPESCDGEEKKRFL